MTAQLQIPPEAIEAVVERWSVLSHATDDEITAVLEENDWASHVGEELIRVAAPHLFSLFAERLTSDEAVEAACRGEWGDEWPNFDGWRGECERTYKRFALEAVAAALVPDELQDALLALRTELTKEDD